MYKEQGRDEFIRKRIARQKQLRKRRLIISLIVLIVFLILLGIILSLTVFFPIKNITAKGSNVYSAEQIVNASGIKKGDNVFLLSDSSVLAKLKEKLPYIEKLDIDRDLNGDIKLTVKDADEYAVMMNKGRYYLVSKSGWVLSVTDGPKNNLFEILGVEAECKVGSEIVYKESAQKELIDRITSALKDEKLKINFVDITDTLDLQVGVEDRFTVLIGSSNNVEEKVKHLSGMIKKISPQSLGKINLTMWTPENTTATFVEKKD